MTLTVESSTNVVARVAIVTAERAAFSWLSELVQATSAARFSPVWWEDLPDGPSDPSSSVELYLLDGRDRRGPGRGVWRRLQDAGLGHAAVLVTPTEEEECGDAEGICVKSLTPLRLAQALYRAERSVALQAALRESRAELAARSAAQEALDAARLRQQRLLQGIIDSLPLLIGRIDAEGRVVEAQGALRLPQIEAAQLQGRRLSSAVPQSRQAVAQAMAGETASFALRGRRGKDEWHAEFVLIPELGPAPNAIFVGRDITERRWLEQQLLTTADAEQRRIGADLHDGLGQQLTGLACLATALRDQLRASHDPQLADQAEFIAEVANDATRQSRALARGLCPVQLEGATIESALSDLTYQAEQLHGVRCRFRARRHQALLDHFTAIHLYRITQEALHNAVRHGKARNVRVTLVSCGPRHRLTVADDGCGFEPRQSAPVSSRGLRLMRYRAGMIGGTLSIFSRAGHGTRIVCHFSHFTAPPHEDPR